MLQASGSATKVPAVDYWLTLRERGYDRRTACHAFVEERERGAGDKPGKYHTVWDWRVYGVAPSGDLYWLANGTAPTHGAARAATRKIIRAQPEFDQTAGKTSPPTP